MTKEEAKKALNNTKVYVNGKSKEIQEKLFGIGFQWSVGDKNKVDKTDCPFIYMGDAIIRVSCDMEFFTGHEYKEISADDILNIYLDKFKDGDIVKNNSGTILIYRGTTRGLIDGILTDVAIGSGFYYRYDESVMGFGLTQEYEMATKEEKKSLLDRLNKEGYMFNEETKEVEKIEQPKEEHVFKPFDKVLVRDTCYDIWDIDFFHKINENGGFQYDCIESYWAQCIPYEGNEHLLGTSNSPK